MSPWRLPAGRQGIGISRKFRANGALLRRPGNWHIPKPSFGTERVPKNVPVAELADALDLGSSTERCAGSNPVGDIYRDGETRGSSNLPSPINSPSYYGTGRPGPIESGLDLGSSTERCAGSNPVGDIYRDGETRGSSPSDPAALPDGESPFANKIFLRKILYNRPLSKYY